MRRAAALAAIVTLLTAGPAQADGSSFRTSGSCTHLGTPVLVDAAAAQSLVAEGFTVLEPVPGKAVLALVIQDCASSIDDGSVQRAMLNVVFVFVNPVLSPAHCETYDFFWTTSRNNDWHRAMTDIGMEMGLSPRSSLTARPTAAGGALHAVNDYRRAPHTVSGIAIDPSGVPSVLPLPSVHCHVGPRGLVRQSYDHAFRPGAAVVDAKLGESALFERLGADDTRSASLFASFTWTGVTEIVQP